MRFMIIRKGDQQCEAASQPEKTRLTALMQHNEELLQGGALFSGAGLQPSAKGARIKFSQGKPSVTDGPFADSAELVAGYMMIDVESKQAAIEWVKRRLILDADEQAEIEIREVGCPGGLAGVSASQPSTGATPIAAEDGTRSLHFMVMLKADEDAEAEAGVIPSPDVLAAMRRHNAESVRAGVMLAGDGLQPSAKGARVKFSAGQPSVIDGPFSEAKELIAGYWLIQVKSKQEAIEWAKRYPYPFGAEAEIEIRQVFDAPDFASGS